MTILSQRKLQVVCHEYRSAFNLRAGLIGVNGEPVSCERKESLIVHLPTYIQTNAYGLQEAIRWGEPFVFYPSKGLVSWVVALVDQRRVHGGLLGGEVLAPDIRAEEAVAHLIEQGIAPEAARCFLARLPAWSTARIRQAAMSLHDIFYRITGWQPALLAENRVKAFQQRQISAAMDVHKKSGQTGYPIDKERMLLSLIRAGDQNGARRVLNEMLGAMYLFSPKLAVLRARAIELMGYLTRAAVEDSPLLEPLIERNHQWMQKLIMAPDFETLSHVLMQALDGFMQGIYAHGFNCHHPHVARVLDYIAVHYSEKMSLRHIAEEVGVSVSRVAHLVKQHTGKSVWQHIMRIRIGKARQLLESTDESCAQIAMTTGFLDQSYFTHHFRRLTGTTPAHYRRSLARTVPSAG